MKVKKLKAVNHYKVTTENNVYYMTCRIPHAWMVEKEDAETLELELIDVAPSRMQALDIIKWEEEKEA